MRNFHSYKLIPQSTRNSLSLQARHSTDVEGIKICLGLQLPANVELADLLTKKKKKISLELQHEVLRVAKGGALPKLRVGTPEPYFR